MKDYSKLKALAQEIIKCIGDDSEGEDPSLPKPDNAINDGGQDDLEEVVGDENKDQGREGGGVMADLGGKASPDNEEKKKGRMSMMASMLSKKFS